MTWTHAGQYGPENFVTQPGNRPAAGATVTVKAHGSSDLADLFTDRGKGTAAANPLTADSRGNVTFHAEPGLYDLTIEGGYGPATFVVPVAPDVEDLAALGGGGGGSYDDSLPGDSLGALDPDTFVPTITALLVGVGADPGVAAAKATEIAGLLVPMLEQPASLKPAIRNAADGVAVAIVLGLVGQLSLEGAGYQNAEQVSSAISAAISALVLPPDLSSDLSALSDRVTTVEGVAAAALTLAQTDVTSSTGFETMQARRVGAPSTDLNTDDGGLVFLTARRCGVGGDLGPGASCWDLPDGFRPLRDSPVAVICHLGSGDTAPGVLIAKADTFDLRVKTIDPTTISLSIDGAAFAAGPVGL